MTLSEPSLEHKVKALEDPGLVLRLLCALMPAIRINLVQRGGGDSRKEEVRLGEARLDPWLPGFA
jgi:hypothetical protein